MVGHLSLPFSLISLKTDGIDAILGMDWLSKYKAKLDCAARTIELTQPNGESLICHCVRSKSPYDEISNSPEIRLCFLEGMEELPTLEMHELDVVKEFPDVFPEELPGMPPDRSVEFVIELLPGTAPVSKRPYSMHKEELVELKIQIDELLAKDFIRPSSSSWVLV